MTQALDEPHEFNAQVPGVTLGFAWNRGDHSSSAVVCHKTLQCTLSFRGHTVKAMHAFIQAVTCETEIKLNHRNITRALLQKLTPVRHCSHANTVRAPWLVRQVGALMKKPLCLGWRLWHGLDARRSLTGGFGIGSELQL